MGWEALARWGDDVARIERLAGGVANDVWSVRVNRRLAVARLGARSDADLAWETGLLQPYPAHLPRLITTPEFQPWRLDTLPGSWEAMTQFMEQLSQYPAVAGWARVGAGVLAEGRRRGLDQHFRAGQSMQHLMFSGSSSI